jgi:hypothetical protein
VTLAKFHKSLHETTGLGQLVQHLDFHILEIQLRQFHQENKSVLAGIRDLVSNLRSFSCTVSFTASHLFLDRIRTFEQVEVVRLCTTSLKYFDLLEMKNLKQVHLGLFGDDTKLEKIAEPASSVRQLSLDKFFVRVYAPSPLQIHFFQSIKAKDVTLSIPQVADVLSRSLAALDSSVTSHMTLHNSLLPFILDSQLNRFTRLRHLTLGSSMSANKSFFTAILATPLISLCLKYGFDLDAQSLIDALKGPTGLKELKTLQLDNIEAEEEEDSDDGGYGGVTALPDYWTDTCTMEHVTELRTMARTGDFELSGTTMRVEEISRRILGEWEEEE